METITFTQYFRPDGQTRPALWRCQNREQEIKARALKDAGARFEVENLRADEISLTIEIDGNDHETHALAHEVCEHSPEGITEAVDRLIKRAHNALLEKSAT
jgi:hypothetical protein